MSGGFYSQARVALSMVACVGSWAALPLSGQGSFAQGTINFANNSFQPVYACYNGQIVAAPAGSTFVVALYWAWDGTTDEAAFTMVGHAAGFAFPGVFVGGTRTVSTFAPGGFAMVQVRGWSSAHGSSYEEALVNPHTHGAGKSSILRVDTGDPASIPPGLPASLIGAGFHSFYIGPVTCVPEPSSCAVLSAAVLCLAGFVCKRR